MGNPRSFTAWAFLSRTSPSTSSGWCGTQYLRLRAALSELALSSNSTVGMQGLDSVIMVCVRLDPGWQRFPCHVSRKSAALYVIYVANPTLRSTDVKSSAMAYIENFVNSLRLPTLDPVLA